MMILTAIFIFCVCLLFSCRNSKVNNISSNNSERNSLADSEQNYYGSIRSVLPNRPNSLPTYEEAILID